MPITVFVLAILGIFNSTGAMLLVVILLLFFAIQPWCYCFLLICHWLAACLKILDFEIYASRRPCITFEVGCIHNALTKLSVVLGAFMCLYFVYIFVLIARLVSTYGVAWHGAL